MFMPLVPDLPSFDKESDDLTVYVEPDHEVAGPVLIDAPDPGESTLRFSHTAALRWFFRGWHPAKRVRVMKPTVVLLDTRVTGGRCGPARLSRAPRMKPGGRPIEPPPCMARFLRPC